MFNENFLELLKAYGPLAALAIFAGLLVTALIKQQGTLVKALLEHQKKLVTSQENISKTLENHLSHVALSTQENTVQQQKVSIALSNLLEEQKEFRRGFGNHCIDFALHQERTEREKIS